MSAQLTSEVGAVLTWPIIYPIQEKCAPMMGRRGQRPRTWECVVRPASLRALIPHVCGMAQRVVSASHVFLFKAHFPTAMNTLTLFYPDPRGDPAQQQDVSINVPGGER